MKFQSQSAIKSMGLNSAWDLEDLVELMKKKKVPFFILFFQFPSHRVLPCMLSHHCFSGRVLKSSSGCHPSKFKTRKQKTMFCMQVAADMK